jgi:hypothetical protein
MYRPFRWGESVKRHTSASETAGLKAVEVWHLGY